MKKPARCGGKCDLRVARCPWHFPTACIYSADRHCIQLFRRPIHLSSRRCENQPGWSPARDLHRAPDDQVRIVPDVHCCHGMRRACPQCARSRTCRGAVFEAPQTARGADRELSWAAGTAAAAMLVVPQNRGVSSCRRTAALKSRHGERSPGGWVSPGKGSVGGQRCVF